jgi:hypothetical protein
MRFLHVGEARRKKFGRRADRLRGGFGIGAREWNGRGHDPVRAQHHH